MTAPPANPSRERSVPPGALDGVDSAADGYPIGLPPFNGIGDDPSMHGQAIAYLARIGEESKNDSEEFVTQAVENAKFYRWGQANAPIGDEIVANDIQTAILSITDIQTRDAYAIFIRPVQVRDKAQAFWIGPADVNGRVSMAFPGLPPGLGMEPAIDPMTGQPAMQMAVDPMTGQPAVDPMTGQPAMQPVMQEVQRRDTPLDEIVAYQVRKLAASGAFPAEWLFVLDHKAVADVYQTIFDVFWKEDKLDEFVWENQLKTNVYGYQTSYYGWDADRKRHVVRDISIVQARLDPNAEGSNFELQNDPGYEVVYDVDEAKALWPQLAPLIEQYAREGSPQRTDSYSQFGVASDRNFRRRTVTFLVHWFRNQPMPMSPDEAVKAGHVYDDGMGNYRSTRVEEQPDAGIEPDGAGGGQSLLGDAGTGVGGGEGLEAAGGSPVAPAPVGGLPQAATGGDASGADPAGIGADGANGDDPLHERPVAPPPAWPDTTGIRQVATIAQTQRVVQDIRCEHWDIPMLLNVCIPIPGKPYGQGLPEKLKGLQAADIRLLNAVVTYAETFANPGSVIPQSVADALKAKLKRTHVDPTETLIAPDNLFERFGEKMISWFQPPPLPPAVTDAMAMIDSRMKETSGHPEVMSGTAPSPTSSGRMVEALQAGAAGQFGFLAKSTLRNVERIANLMHYTHLWRLELPDMVEIYGRIPPEIMQLVIDKARACRWDNVVDANGSAGGQRRQKLQEAMSLFAAVSAGTGEPAMPLKLLRDAAGIDDEEASLAYRNELQLAAPQAAPGQPGQPQQEQPGGAPGESESDTQESFA